MAINLQFEDNLSLNPVTQEWNGNISKDLVYRYLKGKYSTVGRLKKNWLLEGDPDRDMSSSSAAKKIFLDDLVEMYDDIKPFSYKEAFEIEDNDFKSKVFGTVDITEMIENLGHERIETAGKRVSRKQFDSEGKFLGMKEYDVVYETHEVYGKELGLRNNVFAVKCWCTSTEDAHWIWIDNAYKNDPLAAIASTFRIAENLIPYIKELKRQGDIMIVELTEDVTPEGNVVALTPEQYFGNLTAES
jgi:hypothetical protein